MFTVLVLCIRVTTSTYTISTHLNLSTKAACPELLDEMYIRSSIRHYIPGHCTDLLLHALAHFLIVPRLKKYNLKSVSEDGIKLISTKEITEEENGQKSRRKSLTQII